MSSLSVSQLLAVAVVLEKLRQPAGVRIGVVKHVMCQQVSELTQRCEQVLVGAHALLANGGVMAGAGNQLTAMAAKHHAVPFVVLVGLQKLSPLFPHDPSVSFNDYKVCCSTHGNLPSD